ncbi:MAG: CvpA family protein [Cyclobacteriaceae bacterium]
MNKLDIFIIVLLLFGAYRGYRSGFLMGLVSLVAIVLGVFGGFKLMGEGMLLLQREFNADSTVLPYLSFLLIFVIIVVGVNILGRMIRATISKTFLGTIDEAMGAILGVFKWLFMMSVILWILDSLEFSLSPQWTEGSFLFNYTSMFAAELAGWMSGFLPFFKETFKQF